MTAYSITSSALPDGARVHSFRGREALARPYRFDVHVVTTEANAVDLAEAIGAKVQTSFRASSRTYGARRVWRDLLADGVLRPAQSRTVDAGASLAGSSASAVRVR